jgi:putative aldouronate transport system permease protein
MYGLVIAFQDFIPSKGVFGSEFVGFTYFFELIERVQFKIVILNTFKISIYKIVLGFPIPIIFSLLLNEIKIAGLKKGVQTIVYLPNFISWVIMAGVVQDMFATNGGLINNLLSVFQSDSYDFLGNGTSFVSVIIGTDIWKGFGWGSVIYLAALSGIDVSLYEAAAIDGAKRWKQTIHITLPGMIPIIVMSAVLNLGNVLNAGFDQIYNLQNDLVADSSEIIDTFAYKLYKNEYAWSQSTLIGFMKSIVSMFFILGGWKLAKKLTNYSVF